MQFLQVKLNDEGFTCGDERSHSTEKCIFGEATHTAVTMFQETHLGPDRRFLDVDGIVGPNTWWALDHSTGHAQKSYIQPIIPEGLSEERTSFLQIPLHEHAIGIKEEPSGSNWSESPEGGIAKYKPEGPPAAWCCRFFHWCTEQAVEKGIIDAVRRSKIKRRGSVRRTRQYARDAGLYYPNDGSYTPRPGDAHVMDGHIGIVTRIELDEDGKLSWDSSTSSEMRMIPLSSIWG